MKRAITEIVDALKASPLLLSIFVVNILVIVILALVLREIGAAARADRATRNALLERCLQDRAK